MREQAVGRGAVPMHRIRWDIDCIAGVQHLRLLAHEADAADSGQTQMALREPSGRRNLAAGAADSGLASRFSAIAKRISRARSVSELFNEMRGPSRKWTRFMSVGLLVW
jgi:hypothetical protein